MDLQARPELNGRGGTIEEFDTEKNRFLVLCDKQQANEAPLWLLLKPENLEAPAVACPGDPDGAAAGSYFLLSLSLFRSVSSSLFCQLLSLSICDRGCRVVPITRSDIWPCIAYEFWGYTQPQLVVVCTMYLSL